MIPVPFRYERAESVGHAIALLEQYGSDAKLLAGGHSLIPLMKLHLEAPAVLIDIGRLEELLYLKAEGPEVAIGALTTHEAVAHDALLARHCGLVSLAARSIGDRQIRARGTIGGSIAYADPAGDLPTALVALDATIVVRGVSGGRIIPAAAFFVAFRKSALLDDEIITEIRVPKLERWTWHYEKFVKRAPDWAVVGCAAAMRVDDGRVSEVRIGLCNMGPTPLRAHAVESALNGSSFDDGAIAEASRLAADGTDPPSDVHASTRYRSHLARVLTTRALGAMLRPAEERRNTAM